MITEASRKCYANIRPIFGKYYRNPVPGAACGLLRDLVLAVRDLACPAWLDANSDDPDVTALTVLEATASPPDPARIDEICSRLLWARFAPGTGRDDPGHGRTGPGQHPARPPAAALRLKPATARTRSDSSNDIRPFIAKDHNRDLRGAMRRPRCAIVSDNGRFPYTGTTGSPAKIIARPWPTLAASVAAMPGRAGLNIRIGRRPSPTCRLRRPGRGTAFPPRC